MTTSPTGSTSSPTSTASLRLRLDPVGRSGPLDGAWWPHSRDLAVEATRLVDDFPDGVGRVSRLVFSTPDWDQPGDGPHPRRLQTARGTVKIGTFPRDDTHVVVLTLSTHQRVVVLVVPPDTDPARAAEVMERAATVTNTDTADTLLGLA
jgi:hypothetical protein